MFVEKIKASYFDYCTGCEQEVIDRGYMYKIKIGSDEHILCYSCAEELWKRLSVEMMVFT